ncbi:MurR/RpiR family transcriptional regulator [Clostridium mediterraneense]|uniref:MurR/RpiR family transcriptional regulator n=1 Tax=Clostridium mediterraneense TaxID=1805472 RepID=UPI000834740C|nr:MurR/RpiR family transcriptional regulator [Clostridium mediterraneense]
MNLEYFTNKYQLTKLEKNLLSYLYKNANSLKKIGIRTVAKENFTSTTSIYKLCKKLGFEGYSDLIYHISYSSTMSDKQDNNIELNINSFNILKNNKEDIIKLFNKYKDKQIILVGSGLSQIICNYMNEKLLLKGFKSISNLHMQFLSDKYSEENLIIAISHSGENLRMIEILEKANKNGIEIISFVGKDNSRIIDLSTIPLIIDSQKNNINMMNSIDTFFPELLFIFEYIVSYI